MRHERVRGLFDALEELRPELELDERRKWLLGRCEGDQELFDEVWSLHETAANTETSFLSPPVLLTKPEDLLGMELHGYQLQSVLGLGGMGAVYRAYGKHGNQEVAIKVLHPSFFGDQESRRRFELELELIGKLKHPNIVRLLTAGEEGGLLWFAMDLVEGWSLRDLQKKLRAGEALPAGAPNIRDARVIARIVRDLADALSCAHKEGVLHRDIKPGNLLVDGSGKAYLADFGLARVLDADPITLTGIVGGTCSYMSPEQARQLKDAVTVHSDIYSTGAVLYELLAGEPPFGLDGSPAVLRHIAEEEVPNLAKAKRGVDPALAICTQKALRLAPEERYSSAQELSEDLTRWLDGRPIHARAPGPMARLRSRARSRRFVAFGALSLVAFILLASGLALWWNDRVSARADWGQVTLEGSALPEGSRIAAEVLEVGTGSSLLSRSYAPLKGGSWQLRVPSGEAWIRIQAPNQSEQEIVRIVLPHGDVRVAPGPVHALPSSVVFVEVAGGKPSLMDRRVEQPALIREVQVEAFQISRHPINNREFEQFLRESGRERGENVRTVWAQEMPAGGVPDWPEMPATDMTQELAQAAAEWWGCRLATRAEWEWAAAQHVSLGADGPNIVIDRPPWLENEDGQDSSFLAYLAFARMGKSAALVAPGEMVLANVKEWTSSPMLHEAHGLYSVVPDMVHICGVHWRTSASAVSRELMLEASFTLPSTSSTNVGFRLVR